MFALQEQQVSSEVRNLLLGRVYFPEKYMYKTFCYLVCTFIDEVKYAGSCCFNFFVGSCYIYISILPFEKLLGDIKV